MQATIYECPSCRTSSSTEMGSKKRASLHVVAGEEALAEHDPGGLEVVGLDLESEGDVDVFRRAITAENRTLERALTDPRILSGIGNAYSDEILHADRVLSRLMRDDWPKTLEELEARRTR